MSESSTTTKLPNEIWKSVFSFCQKEEIRECMSVCSSWYLTAKRELYDKVVIPDVDSGSRFILALAISNNGVYVHHLALTQKVKPNRSKGSPLYSPLCIQFVLQTCPNILSVDLDICNPYYLLRSLVIIKLDKLQQIKISWRLIKRFDSPAVKRYFLLANQLNRKSILSLDMPDIPDSVWTRDDTLIKQDYLSQFFLLEHLTIDQSTHVFIKFPKILSSLPRLKSLHYIAHLRSLGLTNQDILDSSEIKYPNLKLLSLDLFNMSKSDVKYIVNSLPNLNVADSSLGCPQRFGVSFPKVEVLVQLGLL